PPDDAAPPPTADRDPSPGAPAPGAPGAAPPDDGAAPPVTGGGELDRFLEACTSDLREWREGRLDYPAVLEVDLGDSVTYSAVLDVSDDPPPEPQAPGPSPTSAPLHVRCAVSARLVALGDGLHVVDEAWVDRTFTPSGVVGWSWEVRADEPGDDDVRIELRPAVAVGDDVVLGSAVAEYVTAVDVRTPFVRSLGDWWSQYWATVALVAGGVGAAVLGVRRWWGQLRSGTGG
ncbi:hypothetical protein AB6N23_17015, partial [Cellulomonas sp. 179-A 9B4 NHS]|uniref:hypothetical protein n=1 Tax=Cellulomonas sp. 179-A 9B4 NHS TaxID=3142379 RepID=UPI0039A23E7D